MGFHGMTLSQLLMMCRYCMGAFISPRSSNTMSPHFLAILMVNSRTLNSLWGLEPEPRATPGQPQGQGSSPLEVSDCEWTKEALCYHYTETLSSP